MYIHKLRILLISLLLLLPIFYTANTHAEHTKLELITYNVGLAHTFVPLSKERTWPIIKALQKETADVLCLQEVWNQEDQKLFKDQLKHVYPFSMTVKPFEKLTKKAPACTVFNLVNLWGEQKFGTCLFKNCASKSGDEFTSCVINTCRKPFDLLKEENNDCAAAIIAQTGKSMVQALITVLNPFTRVPLFSSQGESGLMLLSKHPLEDQDVLEMASISTSVRRAGLYARVNVNNNDHHFLCTHLTANLETSAPYTGTFKSWKEESLEQANTLINYIKDKNINQSQFILGDLNCSIENKDKNIAGSFTESCEVFTNNQYIDPFMDGQKSSCTYCTDNTLISNKNSLEVNSLIDHAFYKNIGTELMVTERIFDRPVNIITVDDGEITTHLSDHYGIKYTFHFDQ